MESKAREITPWQIVGVSCALVLAVVCLCSVVTFGIMGDIGHFITEPFRRIFQSPPAEFTLAYALQENQAGRFHLGPSCEIYSPRGESFDSTSEPFQREIPPDQAEQIARAALQTDTYSVSSGRVALLNGVPAEVRVTGNQVNLGFDETGSSGTGNWTRSVYGVVEDNLFNGSFYMSDNRSEVINGQGVERSTTVQADFSCPVNWTETPSSE